MAKQNFQHEKQDDPRHEKYGDVDGKIRFEKGKEDIKEQKNLLGKRKRIGAAGVVK